MDDDIDGNDDIDEHIDIRNFQTNKQNLKIDEKYLTKFNLSSNRNFHKNLKYQNKTQRSKLNPSPNQYLTNDPIYIEDFLLSIRLRFNDVFQKIKGTEKIFEDIQEENNISNDVNDIINGAVYLRKLNFNENFPKKIKKKKVDVYKVIEIQKIFKGYCNRAIDLIIDRLRLRQCLIELFCLLVYGFWCKAKLRYNFMLMGKYYKMAKLVMVDELSFKDKIYFKLPNRFYCGTKINNLKSSRLGQEQNLKI